ncbi:hypothetical protein [Candidatus Cytomitobacter primus]|uniref:Uncharacterized protein n=2 Tax=Candidatus Cytomitobacter primus TaxID=2066024 RepID=A0A5C0UG23_9PROT|nr:hypothetical protein [Candidatus Cytomitobacter primus]QEK38670.1 hypothetical protein FZC34_01990 [Candidatus Cytomitobacter primus]
MMQSIASTGPYYFGVNDGNSHIENASPVMPYRLQCEHFSAYERMSINDRKNTDHKNQQFQIDCFLNMYNNIQKLVAIYRLFNHDDKVISQITRNLTEQFISDQEEIKSYYKKTESALKLCGYSSKLLDQFNKNRKTYPSNNFIAAGNAIMQRIKAYEHVVAYNLLQYLGDDYSDILNVEANYSNALLKNLPNNEDHKHSSDDKYIIPYSLTSHLLKRDKDFLDKVKYRITGYSDEDEHSYRLSQDGSLIIHSIQGDINLTQYYAFAKISLYINSKDSIINITPCYLYRSQTQRLNINGECKMVNIARDREMHECIDLSNLNAKQANLNQQYETIILAKTNIDELNIYHSSRIIINLDTYDMIELTYHNNGELIKKSLKGNNERTFNTYHININNRQDVHITYITTSKSQTSTVL